jgi:stage II sporulation protein R
MKKALTPIIALLAATLIIATVPTEAEAAIYEDTVRLHILAPSDSEEDQALKLALRDMILAEYSALLSDAASASDARSEVSRLLPEIEAFANTALIELGYTGGARAYFEYERYGTREYGEFSLPAGTYASLKIVIGEGEGKNWWCVMYPPMCLDIATAEEKYTKAEAALISKSGYKVKFKLLELVSPLFDRTEEN